MKNLSSLILSRVRLAHVQRRSVLIGAFAGVVACCVVMLSYQNGAGVATGLTSTTSAGCGCHGTSPNAGTSVSIMPASGSFIVEPGSTSSYSIAVSNNGGSYSVAGIDVAARTSSKGNSNVGQLSAT